MKDIQSFEGYISHTAATDGQSSNPYGTRRYVYNEPHPESTRALVIPLRDGTPQGFPVWTQVRCTLTGQRVQILSNVYPHRRDGKVTWYQVARTTDGQSDEYDLSYLMVDRREGERRSYFPDRRRDFHIPPSGHLRSWGSCYPEWDRRSNHGRRMAHSDRRTGA
jgi:hypothetical protein